MTNTDDTARFDRMAARAAILIPAVQGMLADGLTHEEAGVPLPKPRTD